MRTQRKPIDLAEGLGRAASPADVSAYLEEFLAELTNMARAAELDFLAYLLRLATAEAEGARLKSRDRRQHKAKVGGLSNSDGAPNGRSPRSQ
jgi:hypothetical protein